MFAQDDAVVNIDGCWLEHSVYVNNVKGMKIHCELTIEQMEGKTLCVIAYFGYEHSENDISPIKSRTGNNNFRSVDNQVCTGGYAYAKYESSYWEDFCLFIPYRELNAAVTDTSTLCCVINVQSKSGEIYAFSDILSFTFYK